MRTALFKYSKLVMTQPKKGRGGGDCCLMFPIKIDLKRFSIRNNPIQSNRKLKSQYTTFK